MSNPQNQDAEFDFAPLAMTSSSGKTIDIVRFVLSIWKPLIMGGMIGTILGVLAYLYMGPVYSASTQVLVSKKASVPIHDGEANRYGDRGDQVQLIQTDLIVERAFKDHGLNEIPALAGAYDPLKEVTEGLGVDRSAGQESSFDNILEINYSHPDKNVAKAVVQSIVEAYRDYLSDTRDEQSKEIHKLLFEKQQKLRTDINKMEKEYQEFREAAPVLLKASPIVAINGVPTRAPSRYEVELTAIEKAQNDNMRRRAGIQAKLATLERMIAESTSREVLEFWVLNSLSSGTAGDNKSSGGSSALNGPPAKAALDQQLLTARMMEHKLLNTLGESHIAVRTLRKEIETILDFYQKQGLQPPSGEDQPLSSRSASLGIDVVIAYRQTLNEQLEELKIDDENLELLHADAQKKAKQSEMFEIEDQRIKDNITLKKKEEQRIFDQIAAYDLQKEQEGYRMKQISQIRINRSLKRVMKIVGFFAVMATAVVFCLAYLREWADSSLKTAEEVRELTGKTVLASVPKFDLDNHRTRNAAIDPTVCYYHRPGSREAESYRTIRTTLFHSMKPEQKVVQFSSPEPSDGKSTTIANMAVAIAQSGKSVLVIDCDLRRPTQHHLFGVKQEIGLTDALLNEIEWANAVKPTVIQGLSLMTAGLCPENPAELLSTAVLADIIKAARESYDIVLLDSPPVLAVSDPSIVAPHADGMVLVVRMEKNRRPTLTRTKETLEAHGVHVFGVVANGFDAEAAAAAGYNYDSYSSYYSEDEKGSSRKPEEVAKV